MHAGRNHVADDRQEPHARMLAEVRLLPDTLAQRRKLARFSRCGRIL